jgi:hypothetical protein
MRAFALLLSLAPLLVSAQSARTDGRDLRPYVVPPPAQRVQVTGTVTDAVTGKPVYECLVEHYDAHGKRLSVTGVNGDGRYALFVPAGEPFELRVTRENGYAELDQRVDAIPIGTATYDRPLKLQPK